MHFYGKLMPFVAIGIYSMAKTPQKRLCRHHEAHVSLTTLGMGNHTHLHASHLCEARKRLVGSGFLAVSLTKQKLADIKKRIRIKSGDCSTGVRFTGLIQWLLVKVCTS